MMMLLLLLWKTWKCPAHSVTSFNVRKNASIVLNRRPETVQNKRWTANRFNSSLDHSNEQQNSLHHAAIWKSRPFMSALFTNRLHTSSEYYNTAIKGSFANPIKRQFMWPKTVNSFQRCVTSCAVELTPISRLQVASIVYCNQTALWTNLSSPVRDMLAAAAL